MKIAVTLQIQYTTVIPNFPETTFSPPEPHISRTRFCKLTVAPCLSNSETMSGWPKYAASCRAVLLNCTQSHVTRCWLWYHLLLWTNIDLYPSLQYTINSSHRTRQSALALTESFILSGRAPLRKNSLTYCMRMHVSVCVFGRSTEIRKLLQDEQKTKQNSLYEIVTSESKCSFSFQSVFPVCLTGV